MSQEKPCPTCGGVTRAYGWKKRRCLACNWDSEAEGDHLRSRLAEAERLLENAHHNWLLKTGPGHDAAGCDTCAFLAQRGGEQAKP